MKQKIQNQSIIKVNSTYNCVIDKIKFIQIGINEALNNNTQSLLKHLNQYKNDLQYIYDFLISSKYSTLCKELEIAQQQKKELQLKMESLELQILLRDETPQQIQSQVQNLMDQNKTLKLKIEKLKKIAEEAQEQAVHSLEISNLNQALFQQIQLDSNSNYVDEKNQEIEILKSQLEELATQQQQSYEEYQQESNHQKMWINQLSNKLQLYEQQADSQRVHYEEIIHELETKLQAYESFDNPQELLQTLVD